MKNILVISPHPDDESIGCGGTIRKHIVDGDHVELIFLTSGEQGGHGVPADKILLIREQEAKEAANILGIQKTEFWREPDGMLRDTEENINRLFEKIEIFNPEIIYVPHDKEEHPDHLAAYRLTKSVRNLLATKKIRPTIRMYEIWTPLQKIDYIVDISSFTDIKRKAILAHKSQCDIMRFDEAILGLNRYRGEMHSWPGGEYAEVFKEMDV